ncbi:MAG: cyclic pyranopterin monophosphate synthase MoaC [Spirochaetes bacterium]|nr:cyclic pyranopterin monophosphate synthase MoaC [Spirochaetota bacterium]
MEYKDTLSHIDEDGNARMVDIGAKKITRRVAVASCRVVMKPETLQAIVDDRIRKGDVFTVAKVAAISAAKRTGELIPLCHPLAPEHVDVHFQPELQAGELEIRTSVTVTAKTGAEMEALQAAAQAALTIYDMCKAVDRGMRITGLGLISKEGGKSGTWKRE